MENIKKLFDYESIKNMSEKKVYKMAEGLLDWGNSLIHQGTQYKQAAVACVYVLFTRKANASEYKKYAEEIAIISSGCKNNPKLLRFKQKIKRALIVMYENNVEAQKALEFIKTHTLKNLYNGKLANGKKDAEVGKKCQKAKFPQSPDPLKKFMEKNKIKSNNFMIVRYYGKTRYLTKLKDIKAIMDDYDLSSFDEGEDE